MKDYSKVKFVKPSVDGTNDDGKVNIKCVNIYPFRHLIMGLGEVVDDFGDKIVIRVKSCAFLDYDKWIPCDENGKELTND